MPAWLASLRGDGHDVRSLSLSIAHQIQRFRASVLHSVASNGPLAGYTRMERAPERVRFAQRSESRQRRLFLKYGYVCVYLAVGQWLPRNDDIGRDEIVASQGRR